MQGHTSDVGVRLVEWNICTSAKYWSHVVRWTELPIWNSTCTTGSSGTKLAKQGREYDVFLTTNAMDTSLRGDVLRVLHDPALAEAWNLRQISREVHWYEMYSNFNDTTWYNHS